MLVMTTCVIDRDFEGTSNKQTQAKTDWIC